MTPGYRPPHCCLRFHDLADPSTNVRSYDSFDPQFHPFKLTHIRVVDRWDVVLRLRPGGIHQIGKLH